MTDMVVYKNDKRVVVRYLRNKECDYINGGDEVFRAELFRYINAKK